MHIPRLYVIGCNTLIFLVLLSFKPAHGQQYFENPLILKPSDGLSLHNIWDVANDNRGFLWIGGSNGLLRYDGQFFEEYHHDPDDPNSILPNTVSAIYYDKEKEKLWLGHWSEPGGISVLDLHTEKVKRYEYDPKHPEIIPSKDFYWIHKDRFGQIWGGTRQNGMVKYNEKQDNFELFTYEPQAHEENFSYTLHNRFEGVTQDLTNDSLLWIGTGAGLLKFNVLTHGFSRYALENNPSGHFAIRTLYGHTDGKIYLGLWGAGLFRFDPITEQFSPCRWDAFGGQRGQSSHILQTIISPSSNRLWITTDWGLLEYDIPADKIVRSWKNDVPSDKIYGVRAIGDQQRVYVWRGNTVAIYDPLRQQVQPFDLHNPDESHAYIFRRFVEDESTGLIWAACQLSEGLYQLNSQTGEWKVFRPNPKDFGPSRSFEGWDILRTSLGELLLLERKKIYKFIESEQRIAPYALQPGDPGAFYHKMLEDRLGNLWIGTRYGGLYKLDPQAQTVEHYYEELIHADFKTPNALWDLREDRNGNIWIRGRGCHVYDVRKDTFYNFPYFFPETKKVRHVESLGLDGAGNVWALGHDQIIGITDADHPEKGFVRFLDQENGLQLFKPRFMTTDDKGNSWLVNTGDLQKIDLRTGASTYFHHDYLLGRTMWGIDQLSKGRMVAGYKRAIGIFHPDSLRVHLVPPRPYVSSFKVFEEERKSELPFYKTTDLYLAPGENFFSFTISAINSSYMPGVSYQYQMEGVDPDWVDPGQRRYIAYTDLSPGSYVFRLKAKNQSGVESAEPYTLNVHIAAPWYLTWPALIAYLFIFGISAYQIFSIINRRRQLKRQLEKQREEADQLKKLDTFKSRFYTNITHEFRTPLTVIQGLAHQINLKHADQAVKEHVKLIEKNSDQLLRLVNQMLDLSKLEANRVELEYIQADIVPFLGQCVQNFETLAADKQIQLNFEPDQEPIVMDFDPKRVREVISNLVANAIKFTPEQGEVKVTLNTLLQNHQTYLEMVVIDNGIGIAQEKLPYLFNRFYQVDDATTRQAEGTGIGLALVRELVDLMGGQVTVDSTLEKGSRFTVQLPITNNSSKQAFQDKLAAAAITTQGAAAIPKSQNTTGEAPLVLIVEDNADVIYYLRVCLKEKYHLIVASNGEEGLQKARGHLPDLIISDVMMPEMDGYTLCHRLKHHDLTNHIPIILLTARATDANRIEGFGQGADAYLIKPFDPEELLIRMEQLLRQRAALKKKYWQAARIRRLEDLDLAPEAQTFVERLDDCIFQNLADPKFKVDQLAAAMFMSRTSLLKEMKKHVGKPPSQYINRARLDLADQLLRETNLTIAAIARQSGFSSDSYFTKKYEAAFGRNPSEQRRLIGEREDSIQ